MTEIYIVQNRIAGISAKELDRNPEIREWSVGKECRYKK